MSIVKSLATTIRETIFNNTPCQVTWNWTHFGFGRTLLHLQPSGVGFPPTLTMTAMILMIDDNDYNSDDDGDMRQRESGAGKPVIAADNPCLMTSTTSC